MVAAHLSFDDLRAACPTLPGADVIDALRAVRPAEDVERSLRVHLESAINEPFRLDGRDLDVLARCAGDGFALGLPAAARVWEIDAERATHETRSAIEVEDDVRLYAWLVGSPYDAWSRLLDLLAAAPYYAGNASVACRAHQHERSARTADVRGVAGPPVEPWVIVRPRSCTAKASELSQKLRAERKQPRTADNARSGHWSGPVPDGWGVGRLFRRAD